MKVVQGIYPGVTTRELDQLAAETCEKQKGVQKSVPKKSHAKPPAESSCS